MAEMLVGEYLFQRLQELGIENIFGVPGDYELALLDLVTPSGLKWMGTPNELVGAYAADGYARLKGAAAVITTFGPGELSALCGIGGAFCELIPVLHIVGYPTTEAQASGKILHHTLGDKSYDHYNRMSSELSCATAVLKEPHNAVAEIDRVLNAMMYHSQTGYIGISQDVAFTKVSSASLGTPLMKTLPPGPQDDVAVAAIVKKVEEAKAPVIIMDGGAARGSWSPHVAALIDALPVSHFVTVLGKGILNEENPRFGGVYSGAGSDPRCVKAIESSDCILWLGQMPSDFNTGMFSEKMNPAAVVDFQRFSVKIGAEEFNARINHVLPKLTSALQASSKIAGRTFSTELGSPPAALVHGPGRLTQDYMWDRFSTFLQAGDLIVTETGTSQLGFNATKLPKGARLWTQGVWGSIGYASGAAVGASIAAKETGEFKRMVLITGEGSLQLTVQAFSLLNRHGLPPVVFILNNKGYTVERFFNGWTAKYNDVPAWDYPSLFKAFAPDVSTIKTFKIHTNSELDHLLNDTAFKTADYPQVVDLDLDWADAPLSLKALFASKK